MEIQPLSLWFLPSLQRTPRVSYLFTLKADVAFTLVNRVEIKTTMFPGFLLDKCKCTINKLLFTVEL